MPPKNCRYIAKKCTRKLKGNIKKGRQKMLPMRVKDLIKALKPFEDANPYVCGRTEGAYIATRIESKVADLEDSPLPKGSPFVEIFFAGVVEEPLTSDDIWVCQYCGWETATKHRPYCNRCSWKPMMRKPGEPARKEMR
jgi:hypothetical protein